MNNIISNPLAKALFETIYITVIVSLLVLIIGAIVGIILYALRTEGLYYSPTAYKVFSSIINVLRSIPFIILLILIMPITNFLMGTIIGANAAIPALVVSVAPLFARLVENTLIDLPPSLLELRIVLNLSKRQLISKVLLKEALPAILGNFTSVIIATIGYSAMAGVIGAGGLGNYAYTVGFQRNDQAAVFEATILILVLVFAIEILNKIIIKRIDYR